MDNTVTRRLLIGEHLEFYYKNKYVVVPLDDNNKLKFSDCINWEFYMFKEWFIKNTDFVGNIGILTGKKSNIVAIDCYDNPVIDPKNLNCGILVNSASERYKCHIMTHILFGTPTSRHYIYKYNNKSKKSYNTFVYDSNTKSNAIRFLSDGMFVIVPPSIIDGKQQTWFLDNGMKDIVEPINFPYEFLNSFTNIDTENTMTDATNGIVNKKITMLPIHKFLIEYLSDIEDTVVNVTCDDLIDRINTWKDKNKLVFYLTKISLSQVMKKLGATSIIRNIKKDGKKTTKMYYYIGREQIINEINQLYTQY